MSRRLHRGANPDELAPTTLRPLGESYAVCIVGRTSLRSACLPERVEDWTERAGRIRARGFDGCIRENEGIAIDGVRERRGLSGPTG